MGIFQQNVHKEEAESTFLLLRLDVKIDDSVIEQVSSHKILGVIIDSQMNYESRIDELCKKLSKRIGLLKHISPCLKQRQRKTYYNGVIKPILLYGSMIWDSYNSTAKNSSHALLKIYSLPSMILWKADPNVTNFWETLFPIDFNFRLLL